MAEAVAAAPVAATSMADRPREMLKAAVRNGSSKVCASQTQVETLSAYSVSICSPSTTMLINNRRSPRRRRRKPLGLGPTPSHSRCPRGGRTRGYQTNRGTSSTFRYTIRDIKWHSNYISLIMTVAGVWLYQLFISLGKISAAATFTESELRASLFRRGAYNFLIGPSSRQ